MMGFYNGTSWGAVIVMCTLMLVVLAGGAVWLASTLRSQQPDARRALDERLARGEISEDEYLSTRSLLDR